MIVLLFSIVGGGGAGVGGGCGVDGGVCGVDVDVRVSFLISERSDIHDTASGVSINAVFDLSEMYVLVNSSGSDEDRVGAGVCRGDSGVLESSNVVWLSFLFLLLWCSLTLLAFRVCCLSLIRRKEHVETCIGLVCSTSQISNFIFKHNCSYWFEKTFQDFNELFCNSWRNITNNAFGSVISSITNI